MGENHLHTKQWIFNFRKKQKISRTAVFTISRKEIDKISVSFYCQFLRVFFQWSFTNNKGKREYVYVNHLLFLSYLEHFYKFYFKILIKFVLNFPLWQSGLNFTVSFFFRNYLMVELLLAIRTSKFCPASAVLMFSWFSDFLNVLKMHLMSLLPSLKVDPFLEVKVLNFC